ncbi:L-threonine 3-dehydrogenase-like isoform X2 [Ptychodera flava]|uniref:L-threonine 3-dehydrogenase-like isoform X2 n=1 Tax=Ptychodera flava TaxID=63121 RepID=UPI00396A3422
MAVAQRAVFVGADQTPCMKFETVRVPPLRPGDTLVRIQMATICGSDMHTIEGRRKENTPSILGHEAVGVVVEHRREDVDLKPGDRVTFSIMNSCMMCDICKGGIPQKCRKLFKHGFRPLTDECPLNGCYASHIIIESGTAIVKVPDNVTDKMAVPVNCALGTMVNARDCMEDWNGTTALIQGAGMLGLYGCALLNEAGCAKVYCTDINKDRLARARNFGAIPYDKGSPDVPKSSEFDVVIEVCGAASVVNDGIDLLKIGGTYIFVGMVHPQSQLDITGNQIIRKCLTIKGLHNYAPWHLERAVQFISDTAQKYPYETLVSDPYPLQNIDGAVKESATQKYCRVAVAAK